MDERDLFPEALRLINECNPKAILIENVRGILDPKFNDYRSEILRKLQQMGYKCSWRLVNSSDFGVSQLRPRALLVGFKEPYFSYFEWPAKSLKRKVPDGELLYKEMASLGWAAVDNWREKANTIAPTLVGGSKKHGGADLGPTRAKKAWNELGIDGHGLADLPPNNDFTGIPRLTLKMTALIQGFPENWHFRRKKTPAYRQVGNAFPPPVAKAIGTSILKALKNAESKKNK